MPTIPIVDDTILPQQPSNIGTDAAISAARRIGPLGREGADAIASGIGAVGKQAGEYVQRQNDLEAHREIALGIVQAAQFQADGTDLLDKNTLNKDGVAEFKNDLLTPAGQQFIGQFKTEKGRAWAQEAMGHVQAHLITKAAADSATASGDATVEAVNTAKNLLTANLLKSPSADGGATALTLWNSTVDQLAATSGLKPTEAAKVSTALRQHGAQEIATAAVQGVMKADPDAGLKLLDSGKLDQYLSGAHNQALRTYADTITKLKLAQGKANEVEDRRIESDAFNQAAGRLMATVIDPQTGQYTITKDYFIKAAELAQLPGERQHPGMVKELIDFGNTTTERQAKGIVVATNPSTYMDFSKRMFSGPGTTNALTEQQVFQARSTGQLSDKDFNFFREAVNVAAKNPQQAEEQREFDKFTEGYKSYIENSTFDKKDPQGHQRFYEFYRTKQQQFLAGRSAGVPIDDMLNPASKSFIGQDITRYQLTPKQQLQFQTQKWNPSGGPAPTLPPVNPAGATTWKPGESMDDFAKRIGGSK